MAKAVGTTPKQLLPLAKVRASLPDSTVAMTTAMAIRSEGSRPTAQTRSSLEQARRGTAVMAGRREVRVSPYRGWQ